ncbi:MAG: hypothetical protein WD767_10765 [Alphaproteobacteria bacterium]
MFRAIPLLFIVVAIWNVLVFMTGTPLNAMALSFGLPSNTVLTITTGEALVGLGLILLYFEILKSTRTTGASIADHALSMALFVAALLELILVPAMGTGSFALIVLLTLVDVIAGFTVTISTARRDIGFGGDRLG